MECILISLEIQNGEVKRVGPIRISLWIMRINLKLKCVNWDGKNNFRSTYKTISYIHNFNYI